MSPRGGLPSRLSAVARSPVSGEILCGRESTRMIWTGAARSGGQRSNVPASLRLHWPEYVMEFAEMGLYLFLTCAFATLFQHPASPIRHMVPNDTARRACFGISVGASIATIALTPWGRQSGGHLNPAMTFTFYRLGKVKLWDAIFYGIVQFAGATAGVALATVILRNAPGDPTVRYAATLPGVYGSCVAFIAELAISFALMLTVLFASNHNLLSGFTPYFVGALYAIFIALETPLSGMSMNPARTFGSAFLGRSWHALWIYFLGPTLGMLVAAEVFLWVRGGVGPYCAKLHHANEKRCIFHHDTRQQDRNLNTRHPQPAP